MLRRAVLGLLVGVVPVSALTLSRDDKALDSDTDESHPVLELLREVGDEERALDPGLQDARPTPATVQMYVMNLAKRADRWECAKKQLEGSPYKFDRFESTSSFHVEETCPHLKDRYAAQALMCTNSRIWEHELVNGTADYVIIFEDDIVLGDKIWDKVQNLLNGPCRDSFDYLVADTFHGTGKKRKIAKQTGSGFCENASPGINLDAIDGSGAQMQIIKRSALQSIMELAKQYPKDTMDHINRVHFPEKLRTGMFQADIAAQFQTSKLIGVEEKSLGCEFSVGGRTDIKSKDRVH